MKYAEVLLEHGFSRKQGALIYGVPDNLKLRTGQTVMVPFQKTTRAGLVLNLHRDKPNFSTKNILKPLEEEGFLYEWQMKLAEWISEYYFCSKYDALRLFLPKNIFRLPKKTRSKQTEGKIFKNPKEDYLKLNSDQKKILDAFFLEKPKLSLIHGITGSGKTEIYKHMIKNCIQNGQQALLLVPEIALTPQIHKVFEVSTPKLTVLHSRVSEGTRAEIWRSVHTGDIPLIIGSRSALFSPFKNLGLIIIDEEHEWTYKQDKNPRYHTRDVALKMQELLNIQVVFGSATPSIETRYAAQKGMLRYFDLKDRISGTALPQVELVDMRKELKAGNHSIFSQNLEQKIGSALAAGEQTILFLNRRGSASSTVCRDCGYMARCQSCETPLTYHARTLSKPSLLCHHCNHSENVPTLCPICHSPRIKHLGLGTERVETELKKCFPTARIQRADRDTMSKKTSYYELHDRLNKGEIDILIGTQMIGKGLDLPNVSLVGVVLADLSLHIPDFRSSERSFQLLTQVAGRAGRRKKQGQVVIQTYFPDHPVLHYSQNHDYEGFYEQEIDSRKDSGLPPFGQLIKLMFLNKNSGFAEAKAQALKNKIIAQDQGAHQIFTAPALIPRIKNEYQWNLLIQGPSPRSIIERLNPADLEDWRIDVDPLISI